MKIRLAITLTISRDQDDGVTVDLIGTHHQIPPANDEPSGFTPPEEKR